MKAFETTFTSTELEHVELDNVPPRTVDKPSSFKLTTLLRWCGGIIFAASAVTFMYQGVYSFSPLTRHWIMLALCAMLGVIGFITGTTLKEEKGARLFLAFSAMTFPLLSSQLGAMLFSLFGQPPVNMPQPLVFTLANSSAVIAIGLLTLAIAIPLSYMAFRVLARSQALVLTKTFALLNLTILIPLRDGYSIATIATLSLACLLWIDRNRLHSDLHLKTFEGLSARYMLGIPTAILMSRSLFYSLPMEFYGYTLILLGMYLSMHIGRLAFPSLKSTCIIIGNLLSSAGWLIIAYEIAQAFNLGDGITSYFALLPLALYLAVQSFTTEGKISRFLRNCCIILASLSLLLAHIVDPSLMISATGIAVSLFILCLAAMKSEKHTLLYAIGCGAICMGNFALQTFREHSSFAWVGLAVIGIIAMLCASLIESKPSWLSKKGSAIWGVLKKDDDEGKMAQTSKSTIK